MYLACHSMLLLWLVVVVVVVLLPVANCTCGSGSSNSSGGSSERVSVRVVAVMHNGSAVFTHYTAQHPRAATRGFAAELHDTCYRLMRLHAHYDPIPHSHTHTHPSPAWQRRFMREDCHEWEQDAPGDLSQASFCRAYPHECLSISIHALRHLSPPSPYTARVLAASAHTSVTEYTWTDAFKNDICMHPDFLSDNATRLLSKVVSRVDYLIPKEDVYSEFTLRDHLKRNGRAGTHTEEVDNDNNDDNNKEEEISDRAVRVLCVMMTYRPNHLLAQAAVEVWGSQCSGMIMFSNETDWSIPTVALKSSSIKENYDVIWNKQKAVYIQTYLNYRHDFDFFFFGDDDTYVVVPNLFYFLHTNQHVLNRVSGFGGLYAGHAIWNEEYGLYYATGGGFVLNALALFMLGDELESHNYSEGHITDVYIADALRRRDIRIMDTRDELLQHTFHHYHPADIYSYTGNMENSVDLGIGNYYLLLSHEYIPGRAGCSKDSIVFHKINSDTLMRLMDVTITLCDNRLSILY